MAGYRKLPERLGDLRRDRGEIARDVETEIVFHLEMRVRDLMAAGASEAEARERALQEFGDVAGLSAWLQRVDGQQQRRRRWWTSLADLHRDVRIGWRSLWRAPVFTTAALATLTLGIGAAVAVFTVVQTVVLRPLPYAEPERLVQVLPGMNFNLAIADAVAGAPSLEAATGLSLWGLTLTGEGEPAQLTAQFADAGFFRVFGVQPVLGRAFGPEHREPARSDVVLLSHGLWQSRFGGDRRVIGRRIALDGSGHHTREVIGVMPAGFNAPLTASGEQVDVWAPLSRAHGRTVATDSTWYVTAVVARLAPGATVERAAQEVRTVMARLRVDYAAIMDEEYVRTAGAVSLLDAMVGDVRDTLWTLLAAVALVLLLACANLANLLLARGDRRRQELAIRAALGAGRGRLVRGLLTESAVLALLGGAGGVLLAQLILSVLRVTETSSLPRAGELRMDLPVLGFALLVSIGSLFLFGLLPALRASSSSARSELSGGARTRGWTRASRRLGSALIAGEIALALVLVTGAGLLLGSLRALRAVEPGMDSSDVLALELAPAPAKYSGGGRSRLFYEQVQQRLAGLPGVRSVGAIQLLPFTNGNWSFPYLAEGHAPPAGAPLPSANFRVVTPGYFDAVDVPLLAGRALADTDGADGEAVGVINRKLAAQLWPGGQAVGRTIRLFGSQPFRVVGVVGDVHQFALDRQPEPEMYVPLAQWTRVSTMIVMVETQHDPAVMTTRARDAIWQIDPDVPIRDARVLADVLGASMARSRFFTGVLTFFGMLAIALGAVGVYGVMAYAVGARLPEYGIRLALGASSRRILRDALLAGLAPVSLGLALGLAGAVAATRLLHGLLFGIEARDPIVLALASLVLGLAATFAIWLPARTLRKLDPTHALRAD